MKALLFNLLIAFVPLPALAQPPDVIAGSTVTITAAWEAPGVVNPAQPKSWVGLYDARVPISPPDPLQPVQNLPIHNARVHIYDTVNPSHAEINLDQPNPPGEHLMLNGTFQFVSKQNIQSLGVALEAANGSVEVHQFSAQDARSYSVSFIGRSYQSHFVNGTGSTHEANAVWSIFHAANELLYQSANKLDLHETQPLIIFYDYVHQSVGSKIARNTHYSKLDRSLMLDQYAAYDWDVISHEFGHKITTNSTVFAPAYDVGGPHYGGNVYHSTNVDAAMSLDPQKALAFAASEGAASWIGAYLLEGSTYQYNPSTGTGIFYVGFSSFKYDERNRNSAPPFKKGVDAGAYGEDSEAAICSLLWDLSDSTADDNVRINSLHPSFNSSDRINNHNAKYYWGKCIDAAHAGMPVSNICEFWRIIFLPDPAANAFLPEPGAKVDSRLSECLDAAESFAEFGIAPLLTNVDQATLVPGTKIEWTQLSTSNPSVRLNDFQIVVYSSDLKALVFKKHVNLPIPRPNMWTTLTRAEASQIQATSSALSQKGVTVLPYRVVVVGSANLTKAKSGPFFSNFLMGPPGSTPVPVTYGGDG